MGVLTDLLVHAEPLIVELNQLSTPMLVAVGTVSFIVLSIVFNVLSQLLFKDKNKPPVVFHYIPWLGSTVIYGMDPYAFFFNNQEKVCIARAYKIYADLTDSTAMYLLLLCSENE